MQLNHFYSNNKKQIKIKITFIINNLNLLFYISQKSCFYIKQYSNKLIILL